MTGSFSQTTGPNELVLTGCTFTDIEISGNPVLQEKIEIDSRFPSFSTKAFLEQSSSTPRFVVEGLFPRGEVTLLPGRSGSGKSFGMLQATICVAAGQSFLGQAVEVGTAIGLFCEDQAHVLRDRIKGVLSALKLAPDDVEDRLRLETFNPHRPRQHVLWRDGEPTQALEDLDRDLGCIKDPALLVIDTAKIVFHDNIVDPEAVRYFIGHLRGLAARHNIALVLVTHVNRHGDTSGTTEWENHSRAVVKLKAIGDHFQLEVFKMNYASPIPPLQITRTSNGAWLPRLDPANHPTRCSQPSKIKSPGERARQAFLEGLDGTTELLSVNKNSPKGNYAPKRIAMMPRARQLRVDQTALGAAMTELLVEGVIGEVPKPGKHKTMVLVRTHDGIA